MSDEIFISPTKKLSEQMGLKKLPVIDNNISEINIWYGYIKYFNRRKCLIIMNGYTRYSVFIYGIRKKELSNLNKIFLTSLIETMYSDNFSTAQINKLIKNKETKIVKKTNQSITGSVRDHYVCMNKYLESINIEKIDTLKYTNMLKINHILNRVPMMCINKGFLAVDRMKELFENKNLLNSR